jgi:hypothetical protein
MRNDGSAAQRLNVPPWTFFYNIHGLELTPYGRQLMNAGPKTGNTNVMLGSGDAIETELPLSTMYNMRALGEYRVQVSCALPGGQEMRSNEIAVRV